MKKVKIVVILLTVIIFSNLVFALDIQDEIEQELDLNGMLASLNKYSKEDFDLNEITSNLIEGKGIDYGKIGNFFVSKLFTEIRATFKTVVTLLIVVILLAIIDSIQIDKNVGKVAKIIAYLVISYIVISNYVTILDIFRKSISSVTDVINTISPFLMGVLIATGEITTSGIVEPLLLFATGLLSTGITYIVIPVINLTLVFKILNGISDSIKLEKLSKTCSKFVLWLVSIAFAIFLGVLELETDITTSVDSITVKTMQTATSNLIPVVGKFVSDSMEIVMGSSQIIGKAIGTVGIIVIIVLALVPLIKILLCQIAYNILAVISEMLASDEKTVNLFNDISKCYSMFTGILTGVIITFIISIGIIIRLFGKVV